MNSCARMDLGPGFIKSRGEAELKAQEVPHAPMLLMPPALLTEDTVISTLSRARRWIVSALELASLVMAADARMLTSGINTARSGLSIVIVQEFWVLG